MGDFYNDIANIDFWELPRGRKVTDRGFQVTNIAHRLLRDGYVRQLNSNAPQAVMKIVSHAFGISQVGKMLNYLGREGQLSFESDEGEEVKGKEGGRQHLEIWKKDFMVKTDYQGQLWKSEKLSEFIKDKELLETKENLSPEQKEKLEVLNDYISGKFYVNEKSENIDLRMRGVKDVTHMILSVGGKQDIDKATHATRNFLEENLKAGGFRYLFVGHNDTENLHFHVMVHNKSAFGKRLYFDKADLFMLRSEYARHLSDMGIERVSTLRQDRSSVIKKIKNRTEILKERNDWYQKKLQKSGGGFNAYQYRAGILRQTQNLIDNIKKEQKKQLGFSSHLKEEIQALKGMKSKLLELDQKEFEKIRDKTLKGLDKDSGLLSNKIRDIDFGTKGSIYADKKKRQHMQVFMKKQRRELKEVKSFITSYSKVSTPDDKIRFTKSLVKINDLLKLTKAMSIGM